MKNLLLLFIFLTCVSCGGASTNPYSSGGENPYDAMGGNADPGWGEASAPENPFTGSNPWGTFSQGSQSGGASNANQPWNSGGILNNVDRQFCGRYQNPMTGECQDYYVGDVVTWPDGKRNRVDASCQLVPY